MSSAHRRIEVDLAVHRAIERGRRSFEETDNDILRRLLLPPRGGPRPAPVRRVAGAPRSRGSWGVEIGGERRAAANMKDAYRLLLRALAASHPQFLDTFAAEAARGRRFVAMTPAALYPGSPHLVRHAEPLADGWYFDSNLSETQIAKRARIAAQLCGLFYGQDVRILDNFREI